MWPLSLIIFDTHCAAPSWSLSFVDACIYISRNLPLGIKAHGIEAEDFVVLPRIPLSLNSSPIPSTSLARQWYSTLQ
jgi:hypothetical protein